MARTVEIVELFSWYLKLSFESAQTLLLKFSETFRSLTRRYMSGYHCMSHFLKLAVEDKAKENDVKISDGVFNIDTRSFFEAQVKSHPRMIEVVAGI